MPVPDLNSSGKQLVDLFKEWIPKVSDSVIGKTSRAINVVGNPGLALGAYALDKLSDTHLGKVALKELDDASMATAHIPITPEIKIGKAVASHMDDVMPMLGMAVPASIREYLFKPVNDKGRYILHDLEDSMLKFAQGIVKERGSTANPSSIAEDATQAVIKAIADPDYTIPKHLESDPVAGLQHIVKDVGSKSIRKQIDEAANFAVSRKIGDVVKDNEASTILNKAASQSRNAEQSILESEKPIDKARQARVEKADSIFGSIVSPKMQAIFSGLQNRTSPAEVVKELKQSGVELKYDTAYNYLKRNQAVNLIKPIVEAKGSNVDSMSIPDLQKLATSQRKMLGISPDDAVETLRRHDGNVSQDTLTLLRRFMMGTPPSKLTPGKSEEDLVKYNLTDLNKALQKLTDLKRGK